MVRRKRPVGVDGVHLPLRWSVPPSPGVITVDREGYFLDVSVLLVHYLNFLSHQMLYRVTPPVGSPSTMSFRSLTIVRESYIVTHLLTHLHT